MKTPADASAGASKPAAEQAANETEEFSGKRALVTGGTKGIGRAIVSRLTRGCGNVIATARSVPAGGTSEDFIAADVSTREGVDHVIQATFHRLGGLDILVNSVGGSSAPTGGVLALSDDDWQQAFDLNLFSAVRLDRKPPFHAEARLRGDHPYFVDSANTAAVRSHAGLRCR